MKLNKLTLLLALAIAVLFGISDKANAQVLLTGGDSTGGWTAPSDSILAYDLGRSNYATGETIQGVSFTAWTEANPTTAPSAPAGVTLTLNADTNVAGFGAGAPGVSVNSFGSSTNDTAMANMLNGIAYNGDNGGLGPVSVTVSGLANGTYQLNEFIFSGSADRDDMILALNGATTNTFNALQQDGYVVQNTFTISSLAPNVTFSVTDGSAGTAVLSGFEIAAEVPEPSTVALIGLGALGLAFLIRRHRTA